MTISDAQNDMRRAWRNGGFGLLVSGAVWLISATIAASLGSKAGVLSLCVGGMLIHPLATVLCKLAGSTARHADGNPLAALALETTVALLLGVALAVGLSFYRTDLFFPAMLLVIGSRYLMFQTLYGLKIYWLCGGVLVLSGLLLAVSGVWWPLAGYAGASIELVFSVIVLKAGKPAVA